MDILLLGASALAMRRSTAFAAARDLLPTSLKPAIAAGDRAG
jgi:hypothetical protein